MRLFTHKERDLLTIYADIYTYINDLGDILGEKFLQDIPKSFLKDLEKIAFNVEYMTQDDIEIMKKEQSSFNKIYQDSSWQNAQNKIVMAFASPNKPSNKNFVFALQLFESKQSNTQALNVSEKLVEAMNEFLTHREVRHVKHQIAMEQSQEVAADNDMYLTR